MAIYIYRILLKKIKHWERKIILSKRQQFVLITFILSSGLILTQLVSGELRYLMTLILTLLTYVLVSIGLREDLKGIEWITLLSLPSLFTASVVLFYFLLPERWLTRIPIAALYAIGIYALLLTENIFNVAAGRTIALLRAAHSVGFLLTLVTYFLLISAILAFRFNFLENLFSITIISFLLAFQSLWSMELTAKASRVVYTLTLVFTIILVEFTWIFAFWPVKPTLLALFLTTCFYGMVSIGQQFIDNRLYKKTILEFLFVMAVVFVMILMTTHWRGNL